MANANVPLEFTGDQRRTVTKLALMMKLVAGVLFLLAGVGIAAGGVALANGSPSGLLAIVEGLVTGLLGLIMLSSSADVCFMVETNFTNIHLGHALRNLTTFYKGQFWLALVLAAVVLIRLFVG